MSSSGAFVSLEQVEAIFTKANMFRREYVTGDQLNATEIFDSDSEAMQEVATEFLDLYGRELWPTSIDTEWDK